MSNKTSLLNFAAQLVPLEVGRKLTPQGLDKTMLISIQLGQALTHYHAYNVELQAMTITLEDVLDRLSDEQRAEVAASKNKQDVILSAVRKHLNAFKAQSQGIINYLEINKSQLDSAKPNAALKVLNLTRQEQGLRPVKRLPKPVKQAA